MQVWEWLSLAGIDTLDTKNTGVTADYRDGVTMPPLRSTGVTHPLKKTSTGEHIT